MNKIILFSLSQKSICTDLPEGVSLQQLSSFQMMVCEEKKKNVVSLNEVFTIYEKLYVFVQRSKALSVFQFDKKYCDFFVFVKTDSFYFIYSLFNKQNFILILKSFQKLWNKNFIFCFLFLCSVFILFKSVEIKNNAIKTQNPALEAKKEIFLTYESFLKNIKNEEFNKQVFVTTKTINKNFVAVQNKNKIRTQKQNLQKQHHADPDVELFLRLKS